jgi:surface protein
VFEGAGGFNADLSNWDVSSATNMGQMFEVLVALLAMVCQAGVYPM